MEGQVKNSLDVLTLAIFVLMKYTLISGASSGIGLEMCRKSASLGRNVLMVSLPGEGLGDLSREIADKYSVETDVYECDLTDAFTPEKIHEWVAENNYEVDFLINNAGFGGAGAFENHTSEYVRSMINLNVRSTTLMQQQFIPDLKRNAPSFMMNTASLVAGVEAPYKAMYSATKTYIKNITIAISYELQDHGVSVSVLLPGATPTNSVVTEQINKGNVAARASVMQASEVASIAIDKALKGKRVITTGFTNRFISVLLNAMPRFILASVAVNQYKQMIKS